MGDLIVRIMVTLLQKHCGGSLCERAQCGDNSNMCKVQGLTLPVLFWSEIPDLPSLSRALGAYIAVPCSAFGFSDRPDWLQV